MKTKIALFLLSATFVACSSSSESSKDGDGGSDTGGQAAMAGSSGTAGDSGASGGGSGGTSGASDGGTSGDVGVSGTGGDAGGGGDAGSGGDTGGEGGGPSLTMGTQEDPGIEGDGIYPQDPPYETPAESVMLLNGATAGTVMGPFIHTQTGTYTDWDMWKFTYYIYVPSQYQPGHAAALMVFNDGYLYTNIPDITPETRFNAPMVFDNLIHEGSMPVTIGVFIFPGTDDGHKVGGGDGGRAIQYDSPNDQYGKFIIEEFLPAHILNDYSIVTDADGWAMAGHSSGGIASIITGWFWSDHFHKILTASPSFPNRGGVFPDKFQDSPTPLPLRIYHLSGTADLGGFKSANDHAADVFMQLGYHFRYRPGQDQHYPPKAAMADFPDALRWLWRKYKAAP